MVYIEKTIKKVPHFSGIVGLTPYQVKAKTNGEVEVEAISLGIIWPDDKVTLKGDEETIESLLSYP